MKQFAVCVLKNTFDRLPKLRDRNQIRKIVRKDVIINDVLK